MWQHPKTNWGADQISSSDFNRIEQNTNFMRGYISGFQLANNTNNTIKIGKGYIFIDDCMFNFNEEWTKSIYTWNPGDTQGALPRGMTEANNTYYHLFAIGNSANGNIDFCFDTSLTANNIKNDLLVTTLGFNRFRRIASLYYQTAFFRLFYQVGDYFYIDGGTYITGHNAGQYIVDLSPTLPSISTLACLNFTTAADNRGDIRVLYSPVINIAPNQQFNLLVRMYNSNYSAFWNINQDILSISVPYYIDFRGKDLF